MDAAGPDAGEWLDLGDDHALQFIQWAPDRDLNPRYADMPDVERYAAHERHKAPSGRACMGFITFDGEVAREISPDIPKWTVESWEPLTLSPSLLCRACGDHGFIRAGRWVRA